MKKKNWYNRAFGKWIYLVIGVALIVNAVVACVIGFGLGATTDSVRIVGVGLFWGVIGVIPLYKAIKLFIKGRGVSEDA